MDDSTGICVPGLQCIPTCSNDYTTSARCIFAQVRRFHLPRPRGKMRPSARENLGEGPNSEIPVTRGEVFRRPAKMRSKSCGKMPGQKLGTHTTQRSERHLGYILQIQQDKDRSLDAAKRRKPNQQDILGQCPDNRRRSGPLPPPHVRHFPGILVCVLGEGGVLCCSSSPR